MRRTTLLAVVLVMALVAGACTTKVHVAAPRTFTTTSHPPTSQPMTSANTSTLATPPPSAATLPPSVPTTTIPACAGEVVTQLPGEAESLGYDNILQPDGTYNVVITQLVYNERSDPITNIHVTFNYVTSEGVTGTGEALASPTHNPLSQGYTGAWQTEVSTTSPVTSATITNISYNDVAAGPGCNS